MRETSSLYLVLTIVFILFGYHIQAEETVWIKGRVLSMQLHPIPDVHVTVKNQPNTGIVTDSDGYYTLSFSRGSHTIEYRHTSYQLFTEKIKKDFSDLDTIHLPDIFLEEKNIQLEETLISGSVAMTTQTISELKQEHREIAGGTSLAIMKPEVQRLETIKDALKYESGIVIQDFFGANDQPRLSIRGSGIQSNPQRRGIYFLQDGVPVNLSDGSFIIGIMDPSISESIEVFKGANALKYGAATLGGAINFNSHTGRLTQGIKAKISTGSYGYGAFSLMAGNKWGKKDAFISISGSQQDGFRIHNQHRKMNISGNFGYRFSRKVDNRTYINYYYSHFEIPGPLTLPMLLENPKQVNLGIQLPHFMGPHTLRDQPMRTSRIFRVVNRTSLKISDRTQLTASVYYQYLKDRFAYPIVLSTQRTQGHDIGLSIQVQHKTSKSNWTNGLLANAGWMDRNSHINKNGLDSYMFAMDELKAANFTLYSDYNHYIHHRLLLTANIQAVFNNRNSQDVFPNPELRPWYSHTSQKYRYFYSQNISQKQSFWAINPRVGFVYNAGKNKDFQLFTNLSTSYEPPTFDELVGSAVSSNIHTSPKELFVVQLEKQSAITLEAGTRKDAARYSWNLSLYRSWVRNELLEVKDFALGVKKTLNYPNSIHQGIELGFTAIPLQNIISKKATDFIAFKSMYNFNDFYFQTGDYKGHHIAGIPKHYLTASLEYNHPDILFIAWNIETQIGKNPIDHSNTLYQPGFQIHGARIGHDGWKGMSFYFEVKNIFNKHYASSYIVSDQIIPPPIPFPNFGAENVAFYIPGQTRAFFIGFSYQWDKKNRL